MLPKTEKIFSLLLKRVPIFIAVTLLAVLMRYFFVQNNHSENDKNDVEKSKIETPSNNFPDSIFRRDTLKAAETEPAATAEVDFEKLHDSTFVELIQLDSDFVLDIRYATEDNFMKKKVYPCAKAFLRKKTALALLRAHEEVKKMGFRFKIYDAYRPLSVQWILWNSTDKKQYVANPKKGSNHNRGCAVDITLVRDKDLSELDMGTPYDFFGKEAHHSYTGMSKEVRENRNILRKVLENNGFKAVSHEWWHYDFFHKYPVSDFPLPCRE
jgi:D-alanyl-D-alanine dipeptidase